MSTLLATLLLVAGVFGWLETRSAAAVETALKKTRFKQTSPEASAADLHEAIARLTMATQWHNDDAEAQYRMARLWIHLYRIRALEQLRSETASRADDSRLWELTSPVVLHARAQQFARQHLRCGLRRLRNEPVVRDHLIHALKHLVLARRSCPLLSKVHLTISQLCVLAVDPGEDRIHIQRAQELAPADADLLFRSGALHLNAGRTDLAYSSWRKSLTLTSRHLADVLRLAPPQLGIADMIDKLLPDSPRLLIQLAREKYQDADQAHVRRLLASQAERLVERMELPEDEQCYLRGSIYVLKNLFPDAIHYYSRAVMLRADEVTWRYELATLLNQQGMLGEARRRARLCVWMEPHKRKYRALLRQITRAQIGTQASWK